MGIRRQGSTLASALLIAVALTVAASAPYAAAAPPLQSGLEISDQWCEFKLDYEGDGEGNETFDPADGNYLPQETGILGECNFTVTTPVKATIQFDAELDDWRAKVRVTEEPSGRKIVEDTVHVGNREIEAPAGGMVVKVDLINGSTPRGEGRQDLTQGYAHQLQLPMEFRLLEITVVTGAGDRERIVSHDVAAASNAYIEASQTIAVARPSPGALALANELLSEGYPGIAERVVALPVPPPEEGGVNIWMWVTIVLAALFVVTVAVLLIMLRRSEPDVIPAPRPRQ